MSERWVLGVDIGGTNLGVGAVPYVGSGVGALRSCPTNPQRGPDAAVEDIARMAAAVVAEVADAAEAAAEEAPRFVGVGIGCPGPLDLKDGRIISTPNLGWGGYPIRDRISDAVGLSASLDNDANCATYGEWWRGAAKGSRTVVGVTLGTGIGGGLIADGKLVRGASGSAGEIGHMTIDVNGRRCACGNYGCLEAYASGPNIAARAREGLEAGYRSILPDLVDGDLDRITAATVYDALVRGDDYAREVMTETAKMLGAGLANLVNVFNPEIIVVVGGVTRAGGHLFEPLRAEIRRRAFRSAVDACSIVPGALPDTAGVIGAAGVFISEAAA
ncbi:MAG: ROK family protein [Gemmatimonadota bacterium]|nr:ROK family protein [Gemmatimonadota bacterium]MDH3424440.1 ROK family protein [Gemmatimonadota bacterium]